MIVSYNYLLLQRDEIPSCSSMKTTYDKCCIWDEQFGELQSQLRRIWDEQFGELLSQLRRIWDEQLGELLSQLRRISHLTTASTSLLCAVTFDFHPRQLSCTSLILCPPFLSPDACSEHQSSPFSTPYLLDKADLNPLQYIGNYIYQVH
jgi:hypothetical protein